MTVSPYPPETALFTALPRLCISSPMPRTVAHPSEAKTIKSNAERNNLFFFIFTSAYDRKQQLEKLYYQIGQVYSANMTLKFRLLPINPFFAQPYSMLLGLLFSFDQLALDSLNLDDRSELAPLVNNTNRRGAVRRFWSCPCADDIAPVFVSNQGRDIATVEKRLILHYGNFIQANYPARVDTVM
jgi:hypothetical protein